MRALIIEPQILTSFMIEDALNDAGYSSFSFATTEEEAIASAEANPPDLVTVAVRLARGCGIRALEQIRLRGKPGVLYITQRVGQVQSEDPHAIIVRKPFTAAQLPPAIAAVRRAQELIRATLHRLDRGG
jgi:DNA-binding response OmpR family regulator